jgi:hypothetical protein
MCAVKLLEYAHCLRSGLRKLPLTEDVIRRLHALVRVRAADAARDGQNADSRTELGELITCRRGGRACYGGTSRGSITPSEKNCVRPLGFLLPVITIHPSDGNGRTARLLPTFLLHRGGYGLKGYFSLEEHHARDLPAYYGALAVHPHHNYYEGRAIADLTGC